jgi:23S rRNA (pseudouridine1915-N3)-methyltransferase
VGAGPLRHAPDHARAHRHGRGDRIRILILAVGRLRAPFADDVAHYEKLLSRYARVEIAEVAEDALGRRVPERAHVVVLDAGGRTRSSEELAEWLEGRRRSGRDLCFVLGGAFGSATPDADETLSFGPLTLPFQLARVVLLEQLYRAHKILAGEPYHH